MKVLQTAISSDEFRDPASNVDKTTLLEVLALLTSRNRCSLLVVPAGFWGVPSMAAWGPLRARVRRIARRHRIAIVGGIDVGQLGKDGITNGMVKNRKIPFFGFAADSKGRVHGPDSRWQQTSSTCENAAHAQPVNLAARLVHIAGLEVAVVVCGEMHSAHVRKFVGSLCPDLVVVVGHAGIGQGLVPSLKAMNSATEAPVVHAQHLTTKAKMHMVTAQGASIPVPTQANVIASSNPIWAAATVRSI